MIKVEVDSDLEEILPGFLANREKDLVQLKELFEAKDIKGIEKLGHKAAGSCGGYGFDQLGVIAKNLENAAKENDVDQIKKLINEFEEHFTNIEIVFV